MTRRYDDAAHSEGTSLSVRRALTTPLVARRSARILARLGLYGGAVVLGLPAAFSFVLTRAVRQPVSAAPPPFVETHFASEVGAGSRPVRLRAWLLRAASQAPLARPTAVVVHGIGDSLESLTGVATRLAARGHDVLLIDLRGHGGSDDALVTLGAHESGDVRAALRWAHAHGLGYDGFVLLGNSMGAVSVLLAASDRTDVRAVIAEAPFDSYRDTVAHHARLFYGLPRWTPFARLAIAAAEWRAGFDADGVDAVAAAARVPAPLLLIVDGGDARMPESVVRRVFDAHEAAQPGRTTLWVAPGAPHCGASLDASYWPRLFAFLDAAGV